MYVPQGSGFRCQESVLRQGARDIDPKLPNSCLLRENLFRQNSYLLETLCAHRQARWNLKRGELHPSVNASRSRSRRPFTEPSYTVDPMRTTVPPKIDLSSLKLASTFAPASFATSTTSASRSSFPSSRAVTISAGRIPCCSCKILRQSAADR